MTCRSRPFCQIAVPDHAVLNVGRVRELRASHTQSMNRPSDRDDDVEIVQRIAGLMPVEKMPGGTRRTA